MGEAIQLLGPYGALGERIEILAHPPLAFALADALTDLPCDGPPTRRLTVESLTDGRWVVSWPDQLRYQGGDVAMAFYDVLSALNDAAARRIAGDGGVGLHGGAIVVQGGAVTLVGHSGAGKSTLTARLVLDGHAYVADEVTAVSPDHVLLPFHRPIGLRAPSVALLGLEPKPGPHTSSYPLVASGYTELAGPVPLELIAFVERTSDRHPPRAVPLRPAETLQRLCNQTLATQGLERHVFRRLERLARSTPSVALNYADVSDGAHLVTKAAGAPA